MINNINELTGCNKYVFVWSIISVCTDYNNKLNNQKKM